MISWQDAQRVEGSGPGRANNFEPLHAAVLCQAGGYGCEVPPAELREVGCILVADVGSVKAPLAGINAALLPVGDDGARGPVQGAGRDPPVCQVLAGMRAGHRSVGENAPLDGDGPAADRFG